MTLLLSGDTLFQMAEVHRQIQVQLEDVVRKILLFVTKLFIWLNSFLILSSVYLGFIMICMT